MQLSAVIHNITNMSAERETIFYEEQAVIEGDPVLRDCIIDSLEQVLQRLASSENAKATGQRDTYLHIAKNSLYALSSEALRTGLKERASSNPELFLGLLYSVIDSVISFPLPDASWSDSIEYRMAFENGIASGMRMLARLSQCLPKDLLAQEIMCIFRRSATLMNALLKCHEHVQDDAAGKFLAWNAGVYRSLCNVLTDLGVPATMANIPADSPLKEAVKYEEALASAEASIRLQALGYGQPQHITLDPSMLRRPASLVLIATAGVILSTPSAVLVSKEALQATAGVCDSFTKLLLRAVSDWHKVKSGIMVRAINQQAGCLLQMVLAVANMCSNGDEIFDIDTQR